MISIASFSACASVMKRTADATGRRAEWAAAWLLRAEGYVILATRFRSVAGEIDLIARRRKLVAFVEVKARRDTAVALESVLPRQRLRIQRTAEHFLRTRPELADHELRFDVIAWRPWRLPLHVKDAWRP
jgi:putative endonuclease